MVKLAGYYDQNANPDDANFDPIPNGEYLVKITAAEMKNTKNGNGQYLNVEMTVVEGPYEGRKVFDRFNLVNPSQEAVRIANAQFAALRAAVGVPDPKDSAELEGIRFKIMVKCAKRNDKPEEMTNEIGKYFPRGQDATTPQQSPETPPWKRNADAPTPAQPGAHRPQPPTQNQTFGDECPV